MNTGSHRLFEALASGGADGGLAPPTVVGLHFQSGVVKRSIASIAAWWFDRGERLEIEVADGLQSRRRRAIAQGIRQCVAPGAASCKVSSSATPSRQRWGRVRRSEGGR